MWLHTKRTGQAAKLAGSTTQRIQRSRFQRRTRTGDDHQPAGGDARATTKRHRPTRHRRPRKGRHIRSYRHTHPGGWRAIHNCSGSVSYRNPYTRSLHHDLRGKQPVGDGRRRAAEHARLAPEAPHERQALDTHYVQIHEDPNSKHTATHQLPERHRPSCPPDRRVPRDAPNDITSKASDDTTDRYFRSSAAPRCTK